LKKYNLDIGFLHFLHLALCTRKPISGIRKNNEISFLHSGQCDLGKYRFISLISISIIGSLYIITDERLPIERKIRDSRSKRMPSIINKSISF
jgi:hypothetical protein